MKTVLKRSLNYISRPIYLDWLIKLTGRNILLPFYHTISDAELPHIKNLYVPKNTVNFKKDIDFFCKYYEPVSIDRLHSIILSGEKTKKPVFHLSFDDGLKEFYTIIAPILEERGIPATVFINTGFVDNKDLFYRYKVSLIIEQLNNIESLGELKNEIFFKESGISSRQQLIEHLLSLSYFEIQSIDEISENLGINYKTYLASVQPYLTCNQIVDLANRGFTIGSHSVDHPFFNILSLDQQRDQLIKSFSFLNSLGLDGYKYFSFPFSDSGVTINFFNWLYEVQECKLSFGISGLKDDFGKTHLHRIPMENTSNNAKDLIKSEYLYYLLKSPLGKNKIYRQ